MDSSHDPLAMVPSRKRPRSRGSTASIRSATTQPNLEHTFHDAPNVYASQWITNDPRAMAVGPNQMTQEDMLLASHLQASRDYSMDAAVNTSMQSVSFQHPSQSMGRHSLSADSFAGNTSFADGSQMMDRDGNDDNDSFVGVPGNSKPASRSSSSANNELEMRQLFTANRHRVLQDVAEELHGDERGPNSERNRQVFAMLWINQVCSKGKGSVPRGRVYANYASRCAGERITVLNPASFGKLVRILFPGLKTRRLGVRGESKYHYVDFALMEEQPELRETPGPVQMPLGETTSFSQSFNMLPMGSSNMHSGRAVLPTPDVGQLPGAAAKRSHEFHHSLYNQPRASTLEQLHSTTTKTAQKLCLSMDVGGSFQSSDGVMLPSIEPFLPSGTDPDAAKSLTALCRSHATSLVECIRFCREKNFFHLFTSFQGTLTMPVQKLFTHPSIAPWIEECDFAMYQQMVRIVSNLTLQVVPKQVLDTLRTMSEKLVPHIRDSFQNLPLHVIRAKEAPATLFAGLLDRALRVNLTAHAAANMLANPANRDLMYKEWISLINVRKISESVPSRGMDDTVTLLLGEMRRLLDPVNVPWDLEGLALQPDIDLQNDRPSAGSTDDSTSNVLDRWVGFLRSLPARFPYASHTDIVWSVQRLGTAAMRDLTIAQGASFGSWWVTKCWIDEMIQFLAEQGGFMNQKSTQDGLVVPKRQSPMEVSNPGTRHSSASDTFHVSRMPESQPDRATFPSAPSASNQQASHDDSGIGIRTPDEDLPGDKFSFGTPGHSHSLFSGTELADL